MMVMVDTTVWIDFFSGKSQKHVTILENLIEDREDICICGIILTEILQGIREDAAYSKTKQLLGTLVFFPMQYSSFVLAAEIYRKLRQKGITIRKTMDCMIAAVALEHNVLLVHNDRDFIPIEKHFGLRTLKSEK